VGYDDIGRNGRGDDGFGNGDGFGDGRGFGNGDRFGDGGTRLLPGRRPSQAWNWLLAIPIIAPLLTPLYNRVDPQLWGMPFFYWYQLGCALLAVAVITAVYRMTRGRS
jgi:hypothetical protein